MTKIKSNKEDKNLDVLVDESQSIIKESSYHNLFDKMNEGLLILSPEGIIEFANPQFAKILGFEVAELIGENGFQKLIFLNPKDLIRNKSTEKGKGINTQYDAQLVHKSGKLIWVNISVSPKYNDDGVFDGTMSLVTDITKKRNNEIRQQAAYNIAKASNKMVLDITYLTTIIHKEIQSVLDASNSFIALFNEDCSEISIPFIVDSHFTLDEKKILFREGELIYELTRYIIETKKYLLISDNEIEPFIHDESFQRKINKIPKCLLGVPIKSGGKVKGAIVVQSYNNSNAFGKVDLDFIRYVSGQMGNLLERIETQEEVVRSEAKYSTLFSKMEEGLLYSDSSGIINMVNPHFCKLMGYTEKELIGKNGYELFHAEEQRGKLKNNILNRKSGESEKYELSFLTKSKKIIWTEISSSPHVGSNGEFLGVMSIVTDITDRKEAEIANAIAFAISEKASEKGVHIVDFCEFIREEIGKAMDATEFFIAQDIGDNIISFPYIKDKYYKRRLPLIRKAGNGLSEHIMNTGESLLLNGAEIKEFLYHSGLTQYSELPKSWIGAPILSEGKVIGAISCKSYTKQDIYKEDHKKLLALVGSYLGVFFERKIHNDTIAESEERFRGLIEYSSELTCIIDKGGLVTYISPSSSSMLGYSPEEVLGTNIFEYIVEEDRAEAIEGFNVRLSEGGRGEYKIYRIFGLNGESHNLRIMFSNHLNNPSIKGLIINAQDVTAMLDVQNKLESEHKNALEYQSMLLSSQLNPHFIFNSLNSIQYYILEQDPLPALEFLSNFAILMRSVLGNSNKPYITLEKEIKFLNVYIELEETRHRSKFCHTIEVSEQLDIHDVLIPPMLLQPYIENTVVHGVGNMSEGGKIEIEFYKRGNMVECSIKDNGVGRTRAIELKSLRNGENHTSYSTEINNSRLNILNILGDENYSGTIVDLFDDDGNPAGTNVVVMFPYMTEDE